MVYDKSMRCIGAFAPAALQGASHIRCTVMKYVYVNEHSQATPRFLLHNLHAVGLLDVLAHVAAVMEQTLEQLVNTFLGTPHAFSPALVLVPACALLAEQGFKLSGMA